MFDIPFSWLVIIFLGLTLAFVAVGVNFGLIA